MLLHTGGVNGLFSVAPPQLKSQPMSCLSYERTSECSLPMSLAPTLGAVSDGGVPA